MCHFLSPELEEDSLDAEGRRPDGTLVFTGTTEFTSRLQARLTEKVSELSTLKLLPHEPLCFISSWISPDSHT